MSLCLTCDETNEASMIRFVGTRSIQGARGSLALREVCLCRECIRAALRLRRKRVLTYGWKEWSQPERSPGLLWTRSRNE